MTSHPSRYGAVTKTWHWLGFLLLLNQFIVAAAMLNAGDDEMTAGVARDTLYEWHKSVGVVFLGLVLIRFVWRTVTPLPDWAPNLSAAERRTIHWLERGLYVCMFVMPISGYLFVMAGDYPLNFFWIGDFPNLVGVNETLSSIAQWTHKITAATLGVAILLHWGMVARHQFLHRDGYVQRMLPFTRQS